MEQKTDFYVTLPSNVNTPYNRENTVANFCTKLPQRIKLNGNWEVGLVEISYPISWYNLKRCSLNMCTYNMEKWDHKYKIYSDYYINEGRYDNIKELINEVNNAAKKYFYKNDKYIDGYIHPKVVYNEKSRKISIIHADSGGYIQFLCPDKYLCYKLGLDYDNIKYTYKSKFKEYRTMNLSNKRPSGITKEVERTSVAKRPIELNAGCQSLYVYSNIVKPVIIGDTRAPLLRLVEVPTNAKFSDQIVIPYAAPHYKPVAVNDFDIIEIHIKDDTNQTIPFEFGRTTIKLHFKKRL